MPKLRRSENPYQKLLVLVRGNMEVQKVTQKDLAGRLGCSPQTVANYFAFPQKIPLGTMAKLRRALDIPADELRDAIPMQ